MYYVTGGKTAAKVINEKGNTIKKYKGHGALRRAQIRKNELCDNKRKNSK